MTPLAAAVPYSAEAAGPFRISMLSMSSGFRSSMADGSWSRENPKDRGLLSTRTPSITRSGAFDSEMELLPRIRIRAPAPVFPLLCVTTAPAVRPWIRSENVATGASSTSSTSTTPTELPSSRSVCCWPVAETTTAPSSMADSASWKSCWVVSPGVTVTVRLSLLYPISVALTSCCPAGARWMM